MEKLADSLQRLGEEDLLQVVEMVHNNKTADTYTKNDVERKVPAVFYAWPLSTNRSSRRRIPC